MKCVKCGQEIGNNNFCMYCGYVNNMVNQTPTQTVSANTEPVIQELTPPPVNEIPVIDAVEPVSANSEPVVPGLTPPPVNEIPVIDAVEPANVNSEPVVPGLTPPVKSVPQNIDTVQNNNMVTQPVSPEPVSSVDNNVISNTNVVTDQVQNTNNVVEENINSSSSKKKLPIFLIVNFALYAITLLIVFLTTKNSSVNVLSTIFMVTLVFFYFICYQKILVKAGMPWWVFFIPIVNVYSALKVSFGSTIAKTIMIATVVSYIVIIILSKMGTISSLKLAISMTKLLIGAEAIMNLAYFFLLGRRFGRSGIITILFAPFVIPTIAFSRNYQYNSNMIG